MSKSYIPRLVETAVVLPLIAGIATTVQASPNPLKISPQSEVLTVQGRGGGYLRSDCGYLTSAPNQRIELNQDFPYLRVEVQSSGDPTLLIDGPGGHFCVLSDNYSDQEPAMDGFWIAGTYDIYVGDRAQGKYSYTLTISQQRP